MNENQMPESSVSLLETRLHRRIQTFLNPIDPRRAELASVLKQLGTIGGDICIFGGAMRDLMMLGPHADLRDVDLVVRDATVPDIHRLFPDNVVRSTRFGGIRLRFDSWNMDIWPLKDTWAFRNRSLTPSFSNLAQTAFLNTEAISLTIRISPGLRYEINSAGFFEAILNRLVEINLGDALSPTSCIVRAIVTMRRFHFGAGPRLARYIVENSSSMWYGFEAAQLRRYGRVFCYAKEFHQYCDALRTAINFSYAKSGWVPMKLSSSLSSERANAPCQRSALRLHRAAKPSEATSSKH